MRAALEGIEPLLVEEPERMRPAASWFARLLANAPLNVNPIVAEFLALGAQARRSNRATRGLTELALETYVPTALDSQLADALLDGQHRLVLITGNAGDGKTAFIQQVERLAIERNAQYVERRQNGNRLRYLTREIDTLYDGSQDGDDQTSDEVLSHFFRPLFVDGEDDGVVRVAAINEGRIRDFILAHRDLFPGLIPVISLLDAPGTSSDLDGTVVVNLNLRSVTAGDPRASSAGR